MGAIEVLSALDRIHGTVSVIGSMNADYTVTAQRLPGPGETITGGPLQLLPGGKSGNQAAAAARIGATVQMFGAVGSDSNAEFLLGALAEAGVNTTHVRRVLGPSGTTVITVDAAGENTIVYSPGSNAQVTVDYVESVREALVRSSVLGLCLESPIETVTAAARICHEAGVKVLLNDSPFTPSLPAELVAASDILLVNEHEMAQLLGYSRQDKKHQGREPITARLIFDLFQAAGADRIMTVDLHAAQEQGFFDGPVDHLTAMPVLLDYVRNNMPLENTTIVSPDAGRIKVSEQWAAKLGGLPLAFIHKTRDTTRPNHAVAHGIIGEVEGRECVVVDDIIDTAGTICEAVRTLREAGAKSVTLVATHGLLSGPAVERLRDCGAREIVLTDTVPVPEEKRLPNMTVLSAAPLLAAGIRSVFESGSVSTLLNGLPDDMRPRNIYA